MFVRFILYEIRGEQSDRERELQTYLSAVPFFTHFSQRTHSSITKGNVIFNRTSITRSNFFYVLWYFNTSVSARKRGLRNFAGLWQSLTNDLEPLCETLHAVDFVCKEMRGLLFVR